MSDKVIKTVAVIMLVAMLISFFSVLIIFL